MSSAYGRCTCCVEEWREISGYKNKYEISNTGRVRSLQRQVKFGKQLRTVPARILKENDNGRGYKYVSLSQSGHKYIHRLVAEAFIGGAETLEVNHKDADKTNNCLCNLEIVPRKENIEHAKKNGLLNGRPKGGKINCEICNLYAADQRHHRFSQTKWARRLYGKLLDDPKNIQHVCRHCHSSHASPDLDHWSENDFVEALGIEPKSKTARMRAFNQIAKKDSCI